MADRVVSIVSTDLETASIDPTPYELTEIRKKQKAQLEIELFTTITNLRSVQAELVKVKDELKTCKEAHTSTKAETNKK